MNRDVTYPCANLEKLLDELPAWPARLEAEIRETLIANLIMLGEIPAPTFGETDRIHFLQQRFCECDLQNISSDELGNGCGILPGASGSERNLLVLAHADTVFPASHDHTITVQADRVVGPAVADNSLGLAMLATLPTLIRKLDLQLNANLVLMGCVHGLGRGNLEGLNFFLDHSTMPFEAGICIEGAQLGRLSYVAVGMLRGEVRCRVPEEYNWVKRGETGAIISLNEVINRILNIPLPRRPRTSVVLGSIEGGKGYTLQAREAVLRFEVRSESDELIDEVRRQIDDIVADVTSITGAEIELDVVATRQAGGIEVGHPLVRTSREIMNALGVETRIAPSISELSALISHQIPAVTLGLTEAERLQLEQESIRTAPLFTGVAQLLALLLAMDGGFCHESE